MRHRLVGLGTRVRVLLRPGHGMPCPYNIAFPSVFLDYALG
jgi:hypothetical protein